MTRHAMTLALLFLAACAGGHGGEGRTVEVEVVTGFQRFTSAEGGFSVEMPAPVEERRVREGPMLAAIVHAVDTDDTRYEIARFDMPDPLDEPARADLIAKVERGLTGRPGARVTGRRTTLVSGVSALDLSVELPEGVSGRWWIFFSGGSRMFQVSALGPIGERHAAGAARFFQSFALLGQRLR